MFCGLIYDLVRVMATRLSPQDIEMLLVVLSHCGWRLRSDDPRALKEIILLVQKNAAQQAEERVKLVDDGFVIDVVVVGWSNIAIFIQVEGKPKTRLQFVLDMIFDLKNNKKRSNNTGVWIIHGLLRWFNQTWHLFSLSSLLKGYSLLKSGSRNSARIPMMESCKSGGATSWQLSRFAMFPHILLIHDGCWSNILIRTVDGGWLVLHGLETKLDRMLVETPPRAKRVRTGFFGNTCTLLNSLAHIGSAGSAENDLMGLANEQRMNTKLRKSIFCVLMGASDYMDAFEKLLKLNLTNTQQREVRTITIVTSRFI